MQSSAKRGSLWLAAGAMLGFLSGLSPAIAAENPTVVRAVPSAPVTPLVFDGDLRDLPTVPDWRPGDPMEEQASLGEDIATRAASTEKENDGNRFSYVRWYIELMTFDRF